MSDFDTCNEQSGALDIKCSNSEVLHFGFQEGSVHAWLENTDGKEAIKPEYMSDFNLVKSVKVLQALLSSSSVRLAHLDNGDVAVKIHQKALGGGGGTQSSNGPDGGKNNPPPTTWPNPPAPPTTWPNPPTPPAILPWPPKNHPQF